ncbi:hypothetical protein T492DRAFT_1116456 [Pavlovales sp. CCMP2436]|nr:hypothetical protein T492DRAFT_1116456 [Pavlovales sp. CCMP2436]
MTEDPPTSVGLVLFWLWTKRSTLNEYASRRGRGVVRRGAAVIGGPWCAEREALASSCAQTPDLSHKLEDHRPELGQVVLAVFTRTNSGVSLVHLVEPDLVRLSCRARAAASSSKCALAARHYGDSRSPRSRRRPRDGRAPRALKGKAALSKASHGLRFSEPFMHLVLENEEKRRRRPKEWRVPARTKANFALGAEAQYAPLAAACCRMKNARKARMLRPVSFHSRSMTGFPL